jgi:hypothetical protein
MKDVPLLPHIIRENLCEYAINEQPSDAWDNNHDPKSGKICQCGRIHDPKQIRDNKFGAN